MYCTGQHSLKSDINCVVPPVVFPPGLLGSRVLGLGGLLMGVQRQHEKKCMENEMVRVAYWTHVRYVPCVCSIPFQICGGLW